MLNHPEDYERLRKCSECDHSYTDDEFDDEVGMCTWCAEACAEHDEEAAEQEWRQYRDELIQQELGKTEVEDAEA